eukprot:5486136-Prymnesium_polylepis.1
MQISHCSFVPVGAGPCVDELRAAAPVPSVYVSPPLSASRDPLGALLPGAPARPPPPSCPHFP